MTDTSFSADNALTPEQIAQGTTFTPDTPADTPAVPAEGVAPQISPEDLAALTKRDLNAQSHIATLEAEAVSRKTEYAEMQARLDQAATVEETLRQQESATVNVDDIVTKATQAMASQAAATAATEQANANFKDVSDTLSEQFGADKVDAAVKQACAEAGMSWEQMVTLAKTNPVAAKKLCNVKPVSQAQPMQSSINTSAYMGQYQQQQETPKVNVMDLRNDTARVTDLEGRIAAKIKELNL